MSKVLDGCLEVSKFDLLSRYYVHFQTNAHGEGIEYYPTTDVT